MSTSITITQQPQNSRLSEYKQWFHISFYTILLLVGQCSATLLERLYFEKGGKNIWIAAFVQSAGFPVLIPFLFYSPIHAKLTNESNDDSSKTKPKLHIMFSLYFAFGLMMAIMDFLYAIGLSSLHLSTFALICASQLGFNAILTFFLNSQKFTAMILNSIVVLTVSVSLVTIHAESDEAKNLSREKQIVGIFCTLAASATFALHHSLLQHCFDKVIKTITFSTMLSMNLYPMIIATCGGIVGLLVSGEWKNMGMEMKEFENGKVSYIMTLVWISLNWQIAGIGMLGLVFEVSSLFSVFIGNLELAITPIFAVIIFRDKINGVKIIAFLLAIWGFLSYMYQHYLDDQKAKEDKTDDPKDSKEKVEI